MRTRTLLATAVMMAAFGALAKQPVDTGHGGAVATISHEASLAAMEILNAGGNAIDAAVAAAATLGVTDPFSCGIGGGGFMLIWSAKDKRVIALDHREVAPASFHPGVFLDAEGKAMDWKATVPNGIAVGVPGTVRGWHEALTRYGTMDFDKVLAAAFADPANDQILTALHHLLVNEGAKIVDEGIAMRASDIDMVYLTGYGFPLHRGGPMCYADTQGLFNVVQTMKRFAANPLDDAAFWQPAPLLARLAAEGKTFS